MLPFGRIGGGLVEYLEVHQRIALQPGPCQGGMPALPGAFYRRLLLRQESLESRSAECSPNLRIVADQLSVRTGHEFAEIRVDRT